jgi:hypothetical protein
MDKWKGTYLENILDIIRVLPNDLQRNMNLIGRLDRMASETQTKLEQAQEEVLRQATSRKGKAEPDIALLEQVRSLQTALHALHVEKLAVAQIVERVAREFCERIEFDQKAFEKELDEVPPDPFEAAARERERGRALGGHDISYYLRINPPPHPPGPNEQTFCFCQQVSHGEMVACDNPSCEIQWFHMACLDMKRAPKGVWYCDECRGMMDEE